MRILVSDAVLSDTAQWPDLEALLDRARRNRCYLDSENSASSQNNQWFNQADPRRQQDWRNASEWATMDAALFRLRTVVADIAPNTVTNPDRLILSDAINLVDRHASLWLENGRNDRNFFLAMMPKEQRQMYLNWEAQRIIRFENGGGLGELRKALEAIAERGSLDCKADRVLFDSDAEVPGHRSRDAAAMANFCGTNHLEHHCLSRRAIENYLPMEALWAWAKSGQSRDVRLERIGKLEAFKRMSDQQQHHFRLKSGWEATESLQVTALYASVTAPDRLKLSSGINEDIASLYVTYMEFMYSWAINEGIDVDLQAMIDATTDWIRVPYA